MPLAGHSTTAACQNSNWAIHHQQTRNQPKPNLMSDLPSAGSADSKGGKEIGKICHALLPRQQYSRERFADKFILFQRKKRTLT